ncbi:MAG TPA: TadE/TadG family type IV pilus assembly protein [Bryobacteraceae bacterium]|jgi:Flp pilus assembly protein TadG
MYRRERGSQSIELALNLLPFMAIIFLILSLSWAIFTKASLQHAVAEGVRYAITSQTMPGKGQDASIKTVIQNNAMGLLNGNKLSMVTIQYYTVDSSTGNLIKTNSNLGGNFVEISVEGYTASPLLPILNWRGNDGPMNSPVCFTVRASDRMEGSPGGIPPTR